MLIDSNVFNQMLSYKPYVSDRGGKKKVKYSLLDLVKDGLGDKWYRLKEGTRQTFDQICFFSAELGFFYASDDYLAEHHNVSTRTIQYRLKELIDIGQVVKVNRRAKRCNGKGKAVYLFVNHPYFKYWTEVLGINCDTNCGTENDEIPCESMDEQSKKVPTYSLPSLKQESNNNIYSNLFENKVIRYVANRVMDSVKQGTVIKSLSSYIDRTVRSLEGQAVYAESMRIEKARKQRQEESSRLAEELGIRKRLNFEDVRYDWLNA